MNTKLSIDKAGRIVLPKPVRDELNLAPGDVLELETCGAQIRLQPVRNTSPLQKERGVWVYKTGEKLSPERVEETIRQIREERERAAVGQEP